jgi:recombination protein RecR
MQNIKEIEELIKIISKLPGLGPKSAKRIVLKLISDKDKLIKPLANILAQVYKNVTRCLSCGSLRSNISGCLNCENKDEKFNKICVVEDIADKWSIENSNIFKGYFHILGGTLASVGNKKEELLINSLVERVKNENIDEVILATSATVEGQTTAYYIQDSLKKTKTKVTKLAQGLPVGGEIESLDDGTLYSAFKFRSDLNSNSD